MVENGSTSNGHDPEFYRGKRLIELKEGQAKFLAGIFEVGGSISLRPVGAYRKSPDGTKHYYESPRGVIGNSDSDEAKIRALAKAYDGTVNHQSKRKTWDWRVFGMFGNNILQQIKPYAPYRQPEIEAYGSAFDPEADTDEKLCIARAFTDFSHQPRSYPDVEIYRELVADPDFLRGVYAGRGVNYSFTDEAPLRIWSQNLPLLAAVGEPYGAEPYAIVNNRWKRAEGARVPVSFRIQLKNEAQKEAFLSTIGLPSEK